MPEPIATELVDSRPVREGKALPPGALAAAAAARAARQADRLAQTSELDGYRVRPDGPPGVGWIIEPIGCPGVPAWFLPDRAAALAAIPRHRLRYGGAAVV